MFDENRIVAAIEKMRARIAGIDKAKVASASAAAVLTFDEFVRFQELKSHAQLAGILTFDEAVTVYTVLGNTVEHFNHNGVAERVVCIKIFHELLKAKLGV